MSQFLNEKRTPKRVREWLANYAVPLKFFFISRSGLFLLVYLGLILIPLEKVPNQWRSHPENLFVDGWARWDSGWYYGIVEQGYQNEVVAIGQDTAFFPVYPILMRLLSEIVGDHHIAGILISNVSFLLALMVLFKLLSRKYGSTISERTLTLICFGAFSFFYSAVYTESVFLLAVVCAFYFCEREKYLWAACWGAVASATRVLGVTLIIPLVLLYLEQRDYDWRRIRPNILVFSISLLGTLSFMLFLAIKHGNAGQFVDSQAAWGTLNPIGRIAEIIDSLSFQSLLTGAYPAMNLVHLLIFLASLILALAYFKKVGLPYTLFSIIGLITSLSLFQGMGRYLAVVFPLHVAAAFFLRNKDLYHLVLYISILLLALFSIMFSHWYWVA